MEYFRLYKCYLQGNKEDGNDEGRKTNSRWLSVVLRPCFNYLWNHRSNRRHRASAWHADDLYGINLHVLVLHMQLARQNYRKQEGLNQSY
ncbi:MAG: hypothetical protein SCARUB_03395 [Candidatus Scalindua rubra]|uniref:Uncharacterized protein n=1 Tax=Candidatus Scalindua rubra TaxID=1872076 RepID=A0A1E3X7D1_9BACT|nr:MAG: hypothetical protein SCARUB_03395 [Candidatus Scalindua rubra]